MELEFLKKEELEERVEGAVKLTGTSVSEFTGGLTVASFEDQYDQGFTLLDQLLADSPMPEGMNIVRDGTNISGSYTFEPPPLDFVADAPKRARNAARMADINNWVIALESYFSDNGEYPPLSVCTEDLSALLSDYFSSKELPTDFSGEQVFSTHDGSFSVTCDSGFFYQYFGDGLYYTSMHAFTDTPGKMIVKGVPRGVKRL